MIMWPFIIYAAVFAAQYPRLARKVMRAERNGRCHRAGSRRFKKWENEVKRLQAICRCSQLRDADRHSRLITRESLYRITRAYAPVFPGRGISILQHKKQYEHPNAG